MTNNSLFQGTQVLYDWMACSGITGDSINGMSTIVQAPNGPYAADSTPIYAGQIVDPFGAGIPAADFSSAWLSIFDTLTGQIINNCLMVSILNMGRGTIDSQGNLTISLTAADMDTSESPGAAQVQRSLLIGWTYRTSTSAGTGQHQVDFLITSFTGLASPGPETDTALLVGAM